MNAHDSEKVIGTLVAAGLCAGRDAGRGRAGALQHLQHSRQGRAEGLPPAADQFKREQARARCSACSAAWRSRKARRFSSRRRTSAWCADRPATPSCREMLVQLEAGEPARHRAEPRHRRDVRDAVHAARQSAPRLHHDHRRLRQIVRLLRGAVHARAGAQPHQRQRACAEARQLARAGYTEIQLLGQNVNSYRDPSPAGWDFATLLDARGRSAGHPPRALHHVASARFRARHRRRDRREPGAVQSRASAGAVRIDARARRDAAALHARRVPARASTG